MPRERKQTFVQLAQTWEPKCTIGGWYYSTKLDGIRFIWDGGASRGVPKEDVPWSNMLKDVTPGQIATGLWSRYGNVIHAPDWWLDKLPRTPMDGEGYMGIKRWQATNSIVSKLPKNRSDEEWSKVKYVAFNVLPPEQWLKPRLIDETNFVKAIKPGSFEWWKERFRGTLPIGRQYHSVLGFMRLKLPENDIFKIHPQVDLPMSETMALETVRDALAIVKETGGEGIMVRRGVDTWVPERSWDLLKVKVENDAEAIVIGYTTGRLTDLGSKLLGKMGAAICRLPNGKTFKVSGFTDAERTFESDEWAIANPDCEAPEWLNNPSFPRGTQITYTFRELTNDGIPKEARFFRIPSRR